MKRKTAMILMALCICVLAAFLAWNLTDTATARAFDKTEEISFTDSWALRKALLIRETDLVGYGCPFSEEYSVTLGGLTFCLAGDGCDSIYIKELDFYYSISNEQHKDLHEILLRYGITDQGF